jgi:hypothetical protein
VEAAKQLELTIRTAQVLKTVGQLVGVEDPTIAKLMLYECIQQFSQLKTFVDNLQTTPRRGESR